MAQRSVKRSESVIDPMFFIPEGTDEFVYTESEIEVVDDADNFAEIESSYDDGSDFADYSDDPDTPDILGVISQTVRTSASGSQVVDVVIEVEDIEGIANYEVRVTKI